MPYEYEKQGFELGDAGRYLPDFWLPKNECWFEVKGDSPIGRPDFAKVRALAAQDRPVLTAVGDVCDRLFLASHVRRGENPRRRTMTGR